MKKVNMLKKILSFSLALALFLTSPASVFAVDAEVPTVEATAENNEGGAQETPVVTSEGENLKSDTLPAGEEQASESQSGSEDISSEDELNNGRAGSTDLGLEKAEGENEEAENADELTEAEAEADDVDVCEHADFRYESNGDGTHKKICKDCDEVVAEAEPCEFDENGKCVLCGYEDPEHKFTLTDENGIVKVTGTKKVLNGATKVVATEITIEDDANEFEKVADALDEEVAKESKSVVDFVAYDITLYDDNNVPVTIQGDVNVVFTQLEVEGLVEDAYETEVYHYENESVDAMKQVETVSADTVQMVTNHFSTYIVAVKGGQNKGIYSSDYVTIKGDYRNWIKEEDIRSATYRSGNYSVRDNNRQWKTNYRLLYVSIFVDDEERVDDELGAMVASFDSASNERFIVTPADGYKLDKVCFAYAGPDDEYLQNYTNYGTDGSYDISGIKNYLETYVSGRYAYYTGNTNYLEIFLSKDTTVLIKDGDLLKDGTLKAELSAELQNQYQGKDIQYKWSKKVGNADWTECEDEEFKVLGHSINENWINIVLDKGTLTKDVKDVKYKVEAFVDGQSIGNSAEYAVEYYNSLQNGGFEIPVVGTDWWAPQYSNSWYKEHGGVWQTTGLGSINNKKDQDIEILNTRLVSKSNTSLSSFSWKNKTGNQYEAKAADAAEGGYQFAEINCEAEGALYQDVLTVKGQELNYWFSHRARGTDQEKLGEKDTMYVVIMPVTTAVDNHLDNQDNLSSYLKKSGVNLSNLTKEHYDSATGVYVRPATSEDSGWSNYQGKYIPTSYATRFYFLAGPTASKDVTIGNFLDRVGFSQELPPVAEQQFSLKIQKTIKGLDVNSEAYKTLKNQLRFKVTVVDNNGNVVNEHPLKSNATINASQMNERTSGNDIILSYDFGNQTIGKSTSYNYIVKEENAELDGFGFDSQVTISKNEVATVKTIKNEEYAVLKSKAAAEFDFVNTYENYTKSITIEKTWDDNGYANRPGKASFDIYGTYTENGKTKYLNPETNKLVDAKTAYTTAELTSADKTSNNNVWSKKIGDDFPIFVDNDVDKLITWIVEEKPIKGYKASEDKVSRGEEKVVIKEVEPTLPAAEGNPTDSNRYDHIDVECWAATESGNNKEITDIKGCGEFDSNNSITIIGYYENNNWQRNEKTVYGYKDGDEWRFNGLSVSRDTKVAFKVLYKGESEWKTVILTNKSTYPQGTKLKDPGQTQFDNYLYICEKLGKNDRPDTIELQNENIYDVSIASCPGNARPDQYGSGGHGIDFVLTPKTIQEHIADLGTGDETHKITNTKSTAKVTISKFAVDGRDQSNPDTNAKYQFEIKKKNGQNLETVTATGLTNSEFTLGGRESKNFELEVGEYVITEKAVVYENENAQNKLTLHNFNTRVVLNEDSENPEYSPILLRTTDERAYTVNIQEDTKVKFENLLYKETRAEIEPIINKRAVRNSEGTYDLTLDFTAPGVTVTSYETVATDTTETAGGLYDVVVVFDKSSSLNQNNVDNFTPAKDAVKSMVDAIAQKEKIDVAFKLVTFGTDATVSANWFKKDANGTYSSFKTEIDRIGNLQNGTNYEAAFDKANAAFKAPRNGSKKVVVFITDGAPNMDKTHNAGSVDPSWDGYASALKAAEKLECDYFYALGVKLSQRSYNLNGKELTPAQILKDVAEKVKAGQKEVLTVDDFSKVADALTGFSESFLTKYTVANENESTTYATKAVITDVLTDYVDFVNADESTRYSIVAKNGDTVVNQNAGTVVTDGKNVTATFNTPSGKTDLGNDTYSVTFKIKATDKAYDEFEKNNSYPKVDGAVTKGDVDTGTHSGKNGFYSNVSANVVFTLNNEELDPIDYKKPVIQITNIFNWVLSKVGKTTQNGLAGAEFELSNNTNTYYGKSETDGTVKWYSNSNRSGDTVAVTSGTYTLKETKAPEGYRKTDTQWTVKVSKSSAMVVESNGVNVTSTLVNTETETLAENVTKTIATLKIENEVAYTLPETGGRGVYVYTIGGVLLMLGACLLLYKNKKNKNK